MQWSEISLRVLFNLFGFLNFLNKNQHKTTHARLEGRPFHSGIVNS